MFSKDPAVFMDRIRPPFPKAIIKKEAFRLLSLFPYDLNLGMQVHAIGLFDLLLHLMDEREHILTGGATIIDEETGVFLADLRITHRKSFESQFFEHLSDKMTIGTLEGGSGASFSRGCFVALLWLRSFISASMSF